MKVLAISPPDDCVYEAEWIERLFDAGLARYHVRKPNWSADAVERFLATIPEACRERIFLHQHHHLVADWALGGCHFKDDLRNHYFSMDMEPLRENGRILSRSLHRIDDLDGDTQSWDAALLSPVFPSISKPGYQPNWSESTLVERIASRHQGVNAELYALGGVETKTAARCHAMGFDGVVLHGTLWQSDDPVQAFRAVWEVLQ